MKESTRRVAGFWPTSKDETDRNRRSIYVFTRRSVPFPMLEVFDRASPQLAHARRDVSTTPQQSLTLFNNDVVYGWSHSLAQRATKEAARCFRVGAPRPAVPDPVLASARCEREEHRRGVPRRAGEDSWRRAAPRTAHPALRRRSPSASRSRARPEVADKDLRAARLSISPAPSRTRTSSSTGTEKVQEYKNMSNFDNQRRNFLRRSGYSLGALTVGGVIGNGGVFASVQAAEFEARQSARRETAALPGEGEVRHLAAHDRRAGDAGPVRPQAAAGKAARPGGARVLPQGRADEHAGRCRQTLGLAAQVAAVRSERLVVLRLPAEHRAARG